jgi:hypothetical protein
MEGKNDQTFKISSHLHLRNFLLKVERSAVGSGGHAAGFGARERLLADVYGALSGGGSALLRAAGQPRCGARCSNLLHGR